MALEYKDFPHAVVPGAAPKLTPSIRVVDKIILHAPKLFLIFVAFVVAKLWFGDALIPWRLNWLSLIAMVTLLSLSVQAGKRGDKLGKVITRIIYGFAFLVALVAMIVAPIGLLYLVFRSIFDNGFSFIILLPLAGVLFLLYLSIRRLRSLIK